MTRTPDPDRIATAHREGEAQRERPVREWTPNLPPATAPGQREALLATMSPAMREAAEAWNRRGRG